jgi:hypothetical protein
MSDTTTTVETRVPTESEAIRRWRFSQLLAAGYSDERAAQLSARPDVDLHLATDLLAQGCPPETAFRILV